MDLKNIEMYLYLAMLIITHHSPQNLDILQDFLRHIISLLATLRPEVKSSTRLEKVNRVCTKTEGRFLSRFRKKSKKRDCERTTRANPVSGTCKIFDFGLEKVENYFRLFRV